MWRIAMILILIASQAQSGAWPRAKGQSFVAVALRHDATDLGAVGYYTLYFEHGLTEKITIGLDLGSGISGKGKAVAFARWPIGATDRPSKWAIELGLGQIANAPVVRPGLAYGLGLPNGWLSVETAAEINLDTGHIDAKADLTWGMNRPNATKWMVQIQTGQSTGDPGFVRLAPSIAWQKKPGLTTTLGVETGLIGDTSTRLKLGLWRDF